MRDRLANLEDGLTERKRSYLRDEVRKAAVSFANSVPEGRTAVLYLGVADDGTIVGVSTQDAEKFQIQVRRVCEDDCFPPIAIHLVEVLTIDGKHVVAFEFGPSKNRPHFAGHAFIRVGSQSVKASASKLDELIASRNTKAGRLIAAKDNHELLTLILPAGSRIPGQHPLARQRDPTCKVEQCDVHSAKFYDIADRRYIDLPLEFLEFGVDRNLNRLLVEYTRT